MYVIVRSQETTTNFIFFFFTRVKHVDVVACNTIQKAAKDKDLGADRTSRMVVALAGRGALALDGRPSV